MNAKEFCNGIYRDLVARLGELTIQEELIVKEKSDIQAQLRLLNALSPELQKQEESIKNKATYLNNAEGC